MEERWQEGKGRKEKGATPEGDSTRRETERERGEREREGNWSGNWEEEGQSINCWVGRKGKVG